MAERVDLRVRSPRSLELPPNPEIDFIRKSLRIDDILAELDRDFPGADPLRTSISNIANLVVINKLRETLGQIPVLPRLHMAISGPDIEQAILAGRRAAEIFYELRLISVGELIQATGQEVFRERYESHAPTIDDLVGLASGGILFIVEPYGKDNDSTAIGRLLNVLENPKGAITVFTAGTPDNMEAFFDVNQGLYSRFPHHISLP